MRRWRPATAAESWMRRCRANRATPNILQSARCTARPATRRSSRADTPATCHCRRVRTPEVWWRRELWLARSSKPIAPKFPAGRERRGAGRSRCPEDFAGARTRRTSNYLFRRNLRARAWRTIQADWRRRKRDDGGGAVRCDIDSHAPRHTLGFRRASLGEEMLRVATRFVGMLLLICFCAEFLHAQSAAQNVPIHVKVVVVTMFERGEDTGDVPGEFQLWVEREHLDQVLPLPSGYHHVRLNQDGVLGLLTGVGTAKAAASVMALGMDSRFDLSKAYWIVAGIGGGDPADVSLGSAVWAEHVVDGDLAFEIDARQIPESWPTGYLPLRRGTPYEQPPRIDYDEVYTLNESLVDWAVRLTQDVPLADSDQLRKSRSRFAGFPKIG